MPPMSRPDAAPSAAVRRDRLRVCAVRLRSRLLGPAREAVDNSATTKKTPITTQFCSWVRPKLSGQLRQMSNATALTSAVIDANPNPQAIPTSSTPSRYTVPKAMVGANCLSRTMTTVSRPINAAAATSPSQNGGGCRPHQQRHDPPAGTFRPALLDLSDQMLCHLIGVARAMVRRNIATETPTLLAASR